jgi:hypothetical protein
MDRESVFFHTALVSASFVKLKHNFVALLSIAEIHGVESLEAIALS